VASKIQTSFSAGELSPTMYARVDQAKFHIGAAKLLNFFVDYRGGASNRPGFELVCRALKSSAAVRMIRFQFSTIQNYELEFGDFYMRVIKDGGLVLEAAKTITGITQANPGVITSNAHGFSNTDQLNFTVLGMTQLNNKDFFAANVTANTFTLVDWNGNPINTAGYGAFISGTVSRVLKVVSPYAAADLEKLKFTQSADVLTICHPSYAPYDLSRASETSWTFTAVNLGTAIIAPTGTAAAANGAGAGTWYSYVVTAVDANGEESIASAPANVANALDIASAPGSVTISWISSVGAVQYNVYKALPVDGVAVSTGALYGYMASSTTTSANDTNIIPDFTVTPPTHKNPLSGNNPATVTYDQQRKVYAGSTAAPETFWMSKPGQFKNFDSSNPVRPDDAITGTLVSRQVNQIKYMLSMPNGLIMLTSGGAWQISGIGDVLSPSTVKATPQAFNGCGDVEPLTINYEILYVQQKGTIVRDLSYNFYTNIYTGADLTILSNHLFYGYTITDWTYAEEPFKIVWAVRSDGKLLSLTYLKEQEVFGWALHETNGLFLSISSIPEDEEDAVYAVIQRTIEGQDIKFIERMHSRLMAGPEDAFFVDCGLSYSGTATTIFGGLDHLEGEIVTILGDGNVFPEQEVVNGTVTLSQACSKAAIGLGYTAQLKTLYLDTGGEPTIQGRRKAIQAFTARVTETRGISMGPDFDHLDDFKDRDFDTLGEPIQLYTGDERMIISGGWTTEGQVCVEQANPLPATILGVIPEFTVGDDMQ
jgi:hypothetical protein